MNRDILVKKFRDININDKFFDSLKNDYIEFEEWFLRKSDKEAYVMEDKGHIIGFLYMKIENGIISDIEPIINQSVILKVGTFKINPHGTRLGERFVKKILDNAIHINANICYVTVFSKHTTLIGLLNKYGFENYGIKKTDNGTELVLVKNMSIKRNNILKDYPFISAKNRNKYLIGIYPEYHTQLFPDSILNNETYNIIKDVAHTNSIHKVYVTKMKGVNEISKGDIIVMYRTKDKKGSAEYTSVATSICTVEEVKHKNDFVSFDHFKDYAFKYCVFSESYLRKWYGYDCYAIKMVYNAALSKRLIRKKLIEDCGIQRDTYWGIIKLDDGIFKRIIELGGVNESIIIN